MKHECHHPLCNRTVDPKMFMCKNHWFALPPAMRQLIWHYYQPGQEITKTPSRPYLIVTHAIIAWQLGREGHHANAKVWETLCKHLYHTADNSGTITLGIGEAIKALQRIGAARWYEDYVSDPDPGSYLKELHRYFRELQEAGISP